MHSNINQSTKPQPNGLNSLDFDQTSTHKFSNYGHKLSKDIKNLLQYFNKRVNYSINLEHSIIMTQKSEIAKLNQELTSLRNSTIQATVSSDLNGDRQNKNNQLSFSRLVNYNYNAIKNSPVGKNYK